MNSTQLENTLLPESISRNSHYLLVAGVASVLVMMILPLPPFLLDFLLAVNIVGALALLLAALSVNHPLKLSTFPSLLLMATLFRLGLNIASTRLILTTGNAGNIIHTFGYFVTKGNLLVGCLVFLILTIIQFVVIAKGAERVAEVAARFTLDALPGKQMSIDADLRAGLLTQEEAKKARDSLQKESKFYGAMDGAMKFVKGDAIAGLLIIFINILGGLFTGILQQGRSLAEAGQVYTLLTIGDGLASQLPALLTAMTAGMIVTRVADNSTKISLGAEIGFQLLSNPQALITASGLALLVGCLPGFPFMLFALIALGLSGTALYTLYALKKKLQTPPSVPSYLVDPHGDSAIGEAHPLLLEVGPELYKIFLEEPRWKRCLNHLYPRLKIHLSSQYGVFFPDLQLTVTNRLRGSFRYHIRLYEIPVSVGMLMPGYCALPNPHSVVGHADFKPEQNSETLHGTPLALWKVEQKNNLETAGLAVFGPEEMLLRHLARVLKHHAADFVGIQEVRTILNAMEARHPELVREVVPKMMSVQKLTEIVRRLVEEGIPVKDFRLILEILSGLQPESKDPVTLTEQVRVGMSRLITYRHVGDEGQLPAYTLHADIEDEIRQAITKNGSESYLALPPERLREITGAVRKIFSLFPPSGPHVILTSLDIRRYAKKIIDHDFPDLPVLSFQELDPKVVICPLGRIEFDEEDWQRKSQTV